MFLRGRGCQEPRGEPAPRHSGCLMLLWGPCCAPMSSSVPAFYPPDARSSFPVVTTKRMSPGVAQIGPGETESRPLENHGAVTQKVLEQGTRPPRPELH